jgi:hypothetical protein
MRTPTDRDPLDGLEVAVPCPVAWSEMSGDNLVRFCDLCRKNVYNISALTRDQARALVERAEGACVRLTRRTDGTVVVGGCWTKFRRARERGLLVFLLMLPIIVAVEIWTIGFGVRGPATMGKMRRPVQAPSERLNSP